MGERVDEIAGAVLRQALQGHGTAGGIPEQAFQLVPPMRGDVGAGVQRNPWTLAQRAPPVQGGRSPSAPKPEPMRRTCAPARSPKAMR